MQVLKNLENTHDVLKKEPNLNHILYIPLGQFDIN
jgi:hypothetical protein